MSVFVLGFVVPLFIKKDDEEAAQRVCLYVYSENRRHGDWKSEEDLEREVLEWEREEEE